MLCSHGNGISCGACSDEIGRLRAEVERLRAALEEIARPKRGGIEASDPDDDWIEYLRRAVERERTTARNALRDHAAKARKDVE